MHAPRASVTHVGIQYLALLSSGLDIRDSRLEPQRGVQAAVKAAAEALARDARLGVGPVPLEQLHGDRRVLEQGLWRELLAAEHEELAHAFERTRADLNSLCHRFDLESGHVG